MCGYAVTAQVETMTGMGKLDRGLFTELYRAVDASPKPAVVVLQEIGGHADYAAHCGEVMATFFTRLGAVGLVSDCGVRDIPEVRAMGFRYFARGAVSSHAFSASRSPACRCRFAAWWCNPATCCTATKTDCCSFPTPRARAWPRPWIRSVRAKRS